MKSRDWKDVAEIVGIGAIVASLVFVGLQMRQSHEIALVTLYQMRADAAREVMAISLENEDIVRAYERMDTDGGELTYAEVYALESVMAVLLNHFENSHFLYQRGFLTEEHWQSDLANLSETLNDPMAREVWQDMRGIYRESYVKAIEEALGASGAFPSRTKSPDE